MRSVRVPVELERWYACIPGGDMRTEILTVSDRSRCIGGRNRGGRNEATGSLEKFVFR